MTFPIDQEDLKKLKSFIKVVTESPCLLNMPYLAFVKECIEKFGGKVPEGEYKMPEGEKCPFGGDAGAKPQPAADSPEDSDEFASISESESEVELDMEGVIEPDKDPAQPMGDDEKTPTDEEVNQADDERAKAAVSYSEQKFDATISHYTTAIELNPGNALFYAKRGQAFLKLNKPNACIRDCNKALELNCDSAAAYKFRGRAYRLLGQFEEAAKDLRQACKLDFDEEVDEWLREVTPNAQKIEQKRIKQERMQVEREVNDRLRAKRRARKEQAKQKASGCSGDCFSGVGGRSAGAGISMADLIPEINSPEIAAAMKDIMSNPANIIKYAGNEKLINILKTLKTCGFPVPDAVPGDAAFGDAKPDDTKANDSGEPKASQQDSADLVDDGLD